MTAGVGDGVSGAMSVVVTHWPHLDHDLLEFACP
jgi:hypothetical protein